MHRIHLTGYGSSSPTQHDGDSPPQVKIAKKDFSSFIEVAREDLRGPSIESYFNVLDKKIRKFLFYKDPSKRRLCLDELRRKFVFTKFIMKSELRRSDVLNFRMFLRNME